LPPVSHSTFPSFLVHYQARLADALDKLVPAEDTPPEAVHRAMRYTLLAPSKRVRGALALMAADLCGCEDRALGVATVAELIHTSSLILDDLPCMDDAPVRRGQPSCHVLFGEATALLASYALLDLAYRTLTRAYEDHLASRLVTLFSEAVGTSGLIGGQADDLLATDQAVTFERLERIHRLKTGVLFSAAATGSALAAGATPPQVHALAAYAKNLGLAFQIIDDLLDVEGDPAETGKTLRRDLKKTTFVSFSGVRGARELAGELCQAADRALEPFGHRASRLRELSAFVAGRSY
jgi:geranylgeranyl pyrophosphate synthase